MKRRSLTTLTEASSLLGVSRQTVSELARRLGIQTKPVELNGRAKGLDEADMRRLRKALGLTGRRTDVPAGATAG